MKWRFWRRRSYQLHEVFGVGSSLRLSSYVDRGGLDGAFTRSLSSERHVAIHGESKQGKSWLRARGLPDANAIRVQCLPAMSAIGVLEEALGILGHTATLRLVNEEGSEGSIEFSNNASLGVDYLLKVKQQVGGTLKATSTSKVESEPIGQTPGNLAWVAAAIAATGRRLVLEEFHHLAPNEQQKMAFLIKALGEHRVHVVVVGIWPRDHLLTYYNGELVDRIDDIHLVWVDADLQKVLSTGAAALNVEFSEEIRKDLVRSALANVGLVQHMAERLCISAGITETQRSLQTITDLALLEQAKSEVAAAMASRFDSFADNFRKGIRERPDGQQVYLHLLHVVADASDEKLLAGLDHGELLVEIQRHNDRIEPENLTGALNYVDRVQEHHKVRPLVLTYDAPRRRLLLADRSFLFFRSHGAPSWPWQ